MVGCKLFLDNNVGLRFGYFCILLSSNCRFWHV